MLIVPLPVPPGAPPRAAARDLLSLHRRGGDRERHRGHAALDHRARGDARRRTRTCSTARAWWTSVSGSPAASNAISAVARIVLSTSAGMAVRARDGVGIAFAAPCTAEDRLRGVGERGALDSASHACGTVPCTSSVPARSHGEWSFTPRRPAARVGRRSRPDRHPLGCRRCARDGGGVRAT
jgi:hypothetical protein